MPKELTLEDFKVGERVKFTKQRLDDHSTDPVYVMKNYGMDINTIHTITKIDGTYIYIRYPGGQYKNGELSNKPEHLVKLKKPTIIIVG